MADKGIHEGHRERMRDRIKKQGVESLQNHEVLEYLLYSFIPRRDTNEIAHRLIAEFGSLSGVLSADAEHLEEVPGMTHNAALFLSSLPGVFRQYLDDRTSERTELKGRAAARLFMGNKLFGIPDEQVVVAALDAHEKIISSDIISSGSGDSVQVTVRAIVDFALKNRASGVLLAHNHPSGRVSPSQADVELTYTLFDTLANVGVALLDHFIFCGSDYYSFEEDGRMNRIIKTKSTLKDGIFYYE